MVLCPSAAATADVDETDPDFPVGVTLTTANDPQVIFAVSGSTTAATPVGYVPPPITVDKRSSAAGGNVAPGETITYTIEITNNTAVTQTGLEVTDPLPTGTSYVTGSAQVSSPVFRVTEYYLSPGTFTGLTYDLTLGQDLAADYFVLVQGSDGTALDTDDRSPNSNYARLTRDPFGTGDLIASGATNQIRIERGASVGGTSWVGVVTVVECVADCDAAGFRLRSVEGVLHNGTAVTGNDTSATAWTSLGQVQLVGGFNGAGCSTGDTDVEDQKVCHARIYPSGTNTINWTRDAGGATSLSDATSTVMVVEWGSEWTVQRARVQGGNGGDGIDAAGEYNTAALGSAVARDNTWVWGTGHTNDQGIGDAGEGVALTLGNGVTQNGTEGTVAAGIEYAGNAVDFEVYALTHPDLATDYRFKVDGDTGALTVNVAVDAAAAGQRMALVTNGQNGTGNAYPRPMLSARYTSDTQVELRRRRSGQPFPAWVQGIDFSAIAGTTLLPDPPDLIDATDGYTLAPGETLTVTLQVMVDDPLATAVTNIVNTATVVTDQEGPLSDQTTDPVVRPAVVVEYNNADFTTEGTTVSYTHEVVNDCDPLLIVGCIADSYWLTLTSDQGWTVDLIDPDTGGIIARDTNGDGVWDGGVTINTGTLAPGERVEYRVRVTVPAGTPAATQDHTRLFAVSNRSARVSDTAEDETTILGPTDFGPVAIIPDNSGVVAEDEWTSYAHRVINRTGVTDTFDLYADSSRHEIDVNWTATIYHDSNGDGVYSPGIDVAINNTLPLANGATQLVFVVVYAPLGTPTGTVDVTHLTAVSRNDDTLFDGATDTTTVVVTGLDLSGGGTRIVDPGDTGVFAGTLVNLGTGADTYALDITYSSLSGLDGLNHPTQLAIDTDADGIPDLVIAEDTDGDGTWDTIAPGYDPNTDNEPDVTVPGGGTLAYELRRTVDPAQTYHREYVTLTVTSSSSGRADSITATNLLAAVTRAGIRGVRVDPEGEVAFVTTTQVGTASFMIYETNDPRGARGRQALHDTPQRSPVPDSLTPILYRVSTRPVTKRFVMIKETETDGGVLWKGPFQVGDRRMRRSFEDVERLMARAGIPHDRVQRTRGMRPLNIAADQAGRRVLTSHRRRPSVPSRARDGNASSRPRGGRGGGGARPYATSGVKIEVHAAGRVEVPVTDLEAAGLVGLRPGIPVYLTSRGARVPFQWVAAPDRSWSLAFQAEGLSTDYSGTNAYVVTVGAPPPGGPVALTDTSKPDTPGFTRVEKNVHYIPSLPEGPDPWQWDVLFSGWPWPDPSWDPAAGDFDLPDLLPGASGELPLRIQVVGYTEHRHSLTATINGLPVGSLDFDGRVEATLEGTVPAETLLASGNTLSITYVGTDLPSSPGGDAMAYIDFLDLAIPRDSSPRTAVFDLTPYQSDLPSLGGVEYLIVTHPLFRAQADRVAALKADDGLKAVVVETDTAYDRFSGGVVEPRAIQALVRTASRVSAALRYVLLIGDDTFDPRDFVEIGSRSFVPSLFGRDATWGRLPSETRYSDVDGDGRPDLRFGRLPVQSIAEAEALVEKIATQAETLHVHQGAQLVVVDNSLETDAPFRAVAEEALALLPAGPNVRWARVDQGPNAARAALLEGWQTGALLTHYFGHAGLTEWADERILTHGDIEAHGSTWKPTVLLTWACLSQWHIGIFGTALNEALLLQPGGGPVASFGPAGITSPARQAILIDALYRELAQPGVSLGEAIRRAKRATFDRDPKAQETVEGFLLLGDPALTLPWPEAVPQ